MSKVRLDRGLAFYPPLCTAESRPVEECPRRDVPWDELTEVLDRLATLPKGERVKFVVEP